MTTMASEVPTWLLDFSLLGGILTSWEEIFVYLILNEISTLAMVSLDILILRLESLFFLSSFSATMNRS